MLRTEAVFQLFFRIKAFAAVAVVPAELAEVNVAPVVNPLQKGLYRSHVLRVCGAHKAVVGYIQVGPEGLEAAADVVYKLLGRFAQLFRRLHDLVAVLVCAGKKERVLAQQFVVAGHGVGHHRGIGVPQMGAGIDVVNGRGDEIAVHGGLRCL